MAQQGQSGLAPEADGELAKYRVIQEEVQKLKGTQQELMQQHHENEMLKEELNLLNPNDKVFKKIGPVMMRHDLSEGKETVNKRMEHITAAIAALEKQIAEKSNKGNEIAGKIQQIQREMQEKAQREAKAIAANQGQEQEV